MNDIIMPKRKLGTGRYDKKLIERMVELSVADNYDDAAKEWIATGNLYTDDVPDWWDRVGFCLCGHVVYYHFEVRNTENDNMILVGSDHINTYQILREISLTQNIAEELITEEMINEWISVRVEAMKANAWWKRNGDMFIEMFDEVKDFDLRVNVNVKKWEYNSEYGMNMPITTLRKRASGDPVDDDYKMASLVWRWNHPDNTRNQQSGRGYPNDKLWTDLLIFHAFLDQHKETCEIEDRRIAQRQILQNREKLSGEKEFEFMCDYYGIEVFNPTDAPTPWERSFLNDVKNRLSKGYELSAHQLKKMNEVLIEEPATEKQIKYLHHLLKNEAFERENITKKEASKMISKLLGEDENE